MTFPFNRKKKVILITGDMLLMLLSIYLGVLICLHLSVNVLEIRTGATIFSVMTYLVCFSLISIISAVRSEVSDIFTDFSLPCLLLP